MSPDAQCGTTNLSSSSAAPDFAWQQPSGMVNGEDLDDLRTSAIDDAVRWPEYLADPRVTAFRNYSADVGERANPSRGFV
jgi:hypothetical protein